MGGEQHKTLWERLCEATPRLEESERSPYLEKICRVRQSSVSRWRTGKHVLGLANAKAISRKTGFCVQYLIDGTGLRRYDQFSEELRDALDKMSPEDMAAVVSFAKFQNQD